MGSAAEKTFYVGQSLNDDIYHTLVFKRRGVKIRAVVDDDTPVLGESKIKCSEAVFLVKLCTSSFLSKYKDPISLST
jgi:hypothetical protein